MFDQQGYNNVLQAAYAVLQNNLSYFGRDFANLFMADYDPQQGHQSMQRAQNFYNWTMQQLAQQNNGQAMYRDQQQLFNVVGAFVNELFTRWVQQQRSQQSFNGGFGQQQRFNQNGFGNNGGFNGGRLGSFGQQPQMQVAGSHLSGDVTPTPAPIQTPQAPQATPMTQATAPILTMSNIQYKNNPLDDLKLEEAANFVSVTKQPLWGDENPSDTRIVMKQREDITTSNNRYTINRATVLHQVIQNNPLDVVKDFFDIAPDSMIGSPFVYRVFYNHLDVLDCPTDDFVSVRDKVVEALERDPDVLLYKKVLDILSDTKQGTWRAITSYLTVHINRALFLCLRTVTNPDLFIQIKQFDDLHELLSSSFTSNRLVQIPEGRRTIEQSVAAAIYNALVLNVDPMFTTNDIPTNAMQSSHAFPYSMKNVYPNKYAIPTTNEDSAESFLEHLREFELAKRTYLLSKRSVVITNALGKNALSQITDRATMVNDPVAQILNQFRLSCTHLDPARERKKYDIEPIVSEEYPAGQLEQFYSNPQNYEADLQEKIARVYPTLYPLDQTIFCVQYGTNPSEYLKAVDVFSVMDAQLNNGQTILSNRKLPHLSLTN